MTVAVRLAALLRDSAGIELPIRIHAWDGSQAGPQDAPVVKIANRRALRRLLWAPGELGLARAYVCADIDVDGDLADGLRRAWQQARSHGRRPRLTAPSPERPCWPRGWGPPVLRSTRRPAKPACPAGGTPGGGTVPPSHTITTSRTSSTNCVSTSTWRIRRRTLLMTARRSTKRKPPSST